MATIRQKRAYKEVVNGSTISGAMVKVGYSKKTAKRTNKLTRSKGWQELIDKYISEEALMKVHKEGLGATKLSGTGGMKLGIKADGSVDSVNHSDLEVPDYAVRHKYLETGYKVRGRLKENETPKGNTINIIIAESQRERIARRVIAREARSTETPHRLPDSNESPLPTSEPSRSYRKRTRRD